MLISYLLVGAVVSPKPAAISINWDLCVLCQEKTGKALQCPNAYKGKLGYWL